MVYKAVRVPLSVDRSRFSGAVMLKRLRHSRQTHCKWPCHPAQDRLSPRATGSPERQLRPCCWRLSAPEKRGRRPCPKPRPKPPRRPCPASGTRSGRRRGSQKPGTACGAASAGALGKVCARASPEQITASSKAATVAPASRWLAARGDLALDDTATCNGFAGNVLIF